MTDLAETARTAHAAYRDLKQHVTDQAGGPAQLVPILTVVVPGADSIVAVCPRWLLRGGVRELTGGREPEVLIYSADAWTRTTPLGPGPRPRPAARGELAAAFKAGDMSVGETLCTVAVTKHACHVLTTAYRYDDRGRPLFEPVSGGGDTVAWLGGTIDDLRVAWG